MWVVLDTNVVVSAFIWQGTPFKLLEAAARGDIKLFLLSGVDGEAE